MIVPSVFINESLFEIKSTDAFALYDFVFSTGCPVNVTISVVWLLYFLPNHSSLFRIFSCHASKPPTAVNNTEADKPFSEDSLYLSKKGIKKKVVVTVKEAHNNIRKTPGSIFKCHWRRIPAIKGIRKRMNGAFFQI